MNGNMPGQVAIEYIRRLRAVGVLTDATRHPALAGPDLGVGAFGLNDVRASDSGDPAQAPLHYRHHPDDPVAITHSSGTTRMPTAVVHSHGS